MVFGHLQECHPSNFEVPMSEQKDSCQVCGKKSDSPLKTCKSCGRRFCAKCQSPSTNQDFCKDCVSMEGVVSKSHPSPPKA
jgi:hypothetical protein